MLVTMPEVSVAVVIPTYLRDAVLVGTLSSVMNQRSGPEEVLVIDQSPAHDDRTREFLEKAEVEGEVRRIMQTKPSVTVARNRGLQETKCDVAASGVTRSSILVGFAAK